MSFKAKKENKKNMAEDYIKNEIDEILKLAVIWNESIQERSSAIPQVIVDRLQSVRDRLG